MEKKDKEKKPVNVWHRILGIGLLCFLVFGLIYYLIGAKNLSRLSYDEFSGISTTAVLTDLSEGTVVEETYTAHADEIRGITLNFGTYSSTLTKGTVHVEFLDGDTVLASAKVEASSLVDNQEVDFVFDEPLSIEIGHDYTVRLYEDGAEGEQVPAVWGSLSQKNVEVMVNGEVKEGLMLYMKPDETKPGHFNAWFFGLYFSLLGLFLFLCFRSMHNEKIGRTTPLTEIAHIFDTYQFLLHQLVDKEFAIKYRRSYLGMVWVVLNPLLTMVLMSAVFSTIFRQSIENFPVYLIVGQVAFNFFNDATNGALPTIVNSSSLINKIYVPKYIFPLSKVIFSFVNYMIQFIPVAMVMIFYRIRPTINLLYLPIIMLAFFMFTLGCSFILSTMMVMMRDTQYLYNLVTTLLSFLTPIFYSIDNFTPNQKFVMSLNPLYQYLSIIRSAVFYGETPTVQSMIIVLALGIVFLWIGIEYFFHKQDKFILYV